DDAILHHGVLQEGVAFLQKPFSLGALARKVRDVIEARLLQTCPSSPARGGTVTDRRSSPEKARSAIATCSTPRRASPSACSPGGTTSRRPGSPISSLQASTTWRSSGESGGPAASPFRSPSPTLPPSSST